MEQKIRWLAVFVYATYVVYIIMSSSGRSYFIDIASNFVIYRPSYFIWFLLFPFVLLMFPMFIGSRMLNLFTLFATAWFVAALAFANWVGFYYSALPFSPSELSKLIAVMAMCFFLLANVAKPISRLSSMETLLVTLTGVFFSFLANLTHLIKGCGY